MVIVVVVVLIIIIVMGKIMYLPPEINMEKLVF